MVFGSWRGWGDADSRLRWLIGQLDQIATSRMRPTPPRRPELFGLIIRAVIAQRGLRGAAEAILEAISRVRYPKRE